MEFSMRNYITIEQVDNGYTIKKNESRPNSVKKVALTVKETILIVSQLLRDCEPKEVQNDTPQDDYRGGY